MAITLLAIAVACMMSFYQRVEAPGADPSVYAGLASSLLAGHGYEFNFEPHTMYPPGLPFVFAAVGTLFGVGYTVRMVPAGVLALAGLVAAYLVLRRRAGDGTALGITLLLASSACFFARVTSAPMSDVPYFALTFLCLYCVDRLWFDATSPLIRVAFAVGLSICLSMALLTRTVGVALLPAVLVFVTAQVVLKSGARGLTRPLSLVLPVGVTGVVLLVWFHWSSTHRAPKYEGEFSDQYVAHLLMKDFHDAEAGRATAVDLAHRVVSNCGCAGAAFTQTAAFSRWIAPSFWNPLVTIPCLLVVLGLFRSIWRAGGDACDWCLVFSLLILLSWWFCDDGQRFLLPIFPIVALEAQRGARRLLGILREKPKQFAALAIGLGFVVLSASQAAVWITRTKPSKQFLLSMLFWLAFTLGGGVLAFLTTRRKALSQLAVPRGPWRRVGLLCFWVFVVSAFLVRATSAMSGMYPDPRGFRHYPSILVSKWINDNTKSDAVMCTEESSILHRLTGRKVVPLPATTNAAAVASIIQMRHISLLVVEEREGFRQPDSRALLAALQRTQLYALVAVARGQGYAIYRLALR